MCAAASVRRPSSMFCLVIGLKPRRGGREDDDDGDAVYACSAEGCVNVGEDGVVDGDHVGVPLAHVVHVVGGDADDQVSERG